MKKPILIILAILSVICVSFLYAVPKVDKSVVPDEKTTIIQEELVPPVIDTPLVPLVPPIMDFKNTQPNRPILFPRLRRF
jgi:hypothetical protein